MPVSPVILLVEDNEDDALLVQRQLQKVGVDFELKTVYDGNEAIRYLAGEGKYSDRENFPMPSLVLLDLNLPIVSGFEVLAWIKEQPALQSLPVIVLIATEDEAVIQKALALGTNYYIPKPPSAETLKAIIDELFWVHTHPLQVLLVDDDPETLPLLQRILSREFPQVQICHVATEQDFQEALKDGKFDVAITDYMLRWSNGFKIARKVKESCPNCPVLMLTASGDEEVAVASLKMGIDDYIVKGPNLIVRLPAAIHNALRIARQRASARKLEQMLQQCATRHTCTNVVATLNAHWTGDLVNPIFAIDRNSIIRLWSRAGEHLWGYSHNDVVGKPVWDLFPDSETKERFSEIVRRVFNEKIQFHGIPLSFRAKNGQTRLTKSRLFPVTDESEQVIFCVCCNTDITEQKVAEERLLKRQRLLEMVLKWGREIASSADLRSCLKRTHRIVCEEIGFNRVGIFLYDPERSVVYKVLGTDRDGNVDETSNVEFRVEGGVFGKALSSPTDSACTTDFIAEYNLRPDHSMFEAKEHMAVSLWAGEKLVGFICVDNLISKQPFTDEQKEMLRLLAGFVGIAIENAKLMEQKERRTELLEKLWRISREIGRITDLRSCILQIRNTVINEFGFDRAAVWLYDPKTDTFCGTFGTGRNGELTDEWDQCIKGDRSLRKALEQPSGVFHTRDYSATFAPTPPIMEGVKEHISVSLWAGDKPVGVITADMLLSQRSISEEQIETLYLFSSYAGVAIENARLVEALKQRTEQQELLTRLVHLATQRLDIDSVSRAVVRELSEVMRETALFVFVAEEGNNLVLNAANDIGREFLTQIGVPIGASFTKSQIDLTEGELDSSNLFRVGDISQVNHPLLQLLASKGFRSLLLAKMVWRGEWIGAIMALREQLDAFTEDETSFFRTVADHLAVAFHNARQFEKLQRTAEELRHTRAALIRQERLRALGQMASGVVHDINNALVPILTFAELLEGMKDESLQEVINHVKRAVDDIVNTVRQLRTFYRPKGPAEEFEHVNLNEVVQHVVSMTKPYWYDMPQREGITVEVELNLDETLTTIMGNESELRQAFINMLFNAVDAIVAKGERLGVIRVQTRRHEDWAILEIVDTGVGMDEETKHRCFEPFFTTKGETRSGLGLSMVYGIVQRHEGKIEVESELGQGTLFRIWFPIAKETAVLVKQPEGSTIEIPSLRVLVIDDDQRVQEALAAMLNHLGHQVVVIGSGDEGITMFEEAVKSGTPFDLVVTDLGMPKVSGAEVVQKVKEISPNTPVIVITGWGAEQRPASADYALSKPVRLGVLREAITKVWTQKQRTKTE
ncbi:MAG: response regulator [Candidatus Fervidibacter sp.]|uniref:response regulator n=1 Tax=Candidatus Fervidibacter sp. TaxID=3100871 RepID=UPI00404A42E6